jgi:anti-sigma B factor antagonist
MNFKNNKINGFQLIVIEEERVDAHNSGDLKQNFLDMFEQGEVNIIVDLHQVHFIDSSGLGALLSGYKNAEAKSGKLVLAGLQEQVASMFELTRLNRVFEIYSDPDEASGSVE